MPRFALIEPSIGSSDDRDCALRAEARWPSSSETSVKSRPAVEPRDDRAFGRSSIAVVSSPPSPAPTTSSRSSRVGSSASTAARPRRAARQSSSQSVTAGWKSRPEGSLG